MPGYYTVRFPSTGVRAELTATTRTGVGRFHYPRNRPARFYVRSGGSLGGNSADNIQIGDDNTTITGSATSGGFCGKNNVYTVYFAMKFSKPFTSFGTWDGYSVFPNGHSAYSSYQGSSGGYVEFPAGSELEVRTALSYVDVDGARENLDEAAESFDDVRAAASTQWNTVLSRIKVAGFDEDDIVTFYTALYHSLLNPNIFNDADGRYIGFDGDIHTVRQGHTQYANFSDWDTYRGVAGLQGLVFSQQASDMAQSLVNDAEQSGSYPRWALANTATAEMTGDSVVPLIANFYAFGAKDFDVKQGAAFHARRRDRRRCRAQRLRRAAGNRHLPAPRLSAAADDVVQRFVPRRLDLAGVVGRRLRHLPIRRRARRFRDRRRIPGPRTVLAEPVQSDHPLHLAAQCARFLSRGPAVVPPGEGCFSQVGFDEGNAEQYVWYVPQNIAGLVTALGGRKAVVDRLDRFTAQLNVGPDGAVSVGR